MPTGIADLAWLAARLERLAVEMPGARALVSLHLANNETGVLQPIAEVAAIAKRFGALVHSDAVQAAGKIAIDINALGVDVLTHFGPQVRRAEGHRRDRVPDRGAGAWPTSRCAAAGRSAAGGPAPRTCRASSASGWRRRSQRKAQASEAERLSGLRDRLEAGLLALAPDTAIFGHSAPRLPNTSAFATPGLGPRRR
jgi:cysteine desulfurase